MLAPAAIAPPLPTAPFGGATAPPGILAGQPLPPAKVKKEGDDASPLSLSSCCMSPMPDKMKSRLLVLIGITKAWRLSAAMINYPTNHGGGMRGVIGCKGVDGL